MDNILDFNTAKRQGEIRNSDISAESIRERLNAQASSFVQWLFSGRALIARGEARVGNIYGIPGASLRISLSGINTGLWKDHATNEGGDLISLYRANMGYSGTSDFALSLKEIARDFLGDAVEIDRPTWRPTPLEMIEAAKAKLGTKPREDMAELGAPVATYKYFDTRGNVIAAVTRYEPDGTRASKTFRPYCFKTIEGVTKWVKGAPDLPSSCTGYARRCPAAGFDGVGASRGRGQGGVAALCRHHRHNGDAGGPGADRENRLVASGRQGGDNLAR